MGLERIEARDRQAAADQARGFLDELTALHAQHHLSLTYVAAGEIRAVEGDDGPAETVREILRLARVGAHAEAMALSFPHVKVRTVVAEAGR